MNAELRALISSESTNQRYKLLKTNPKDIFDALIYQSIVDFVYSAYKNWEKHKNLPDEIFNTILRRKR
ncbi:MAG: hypothetical protein ABR927_03770 [Bacteroidales bacterium]|jgi:galactokinase/mevalonate kinase-like predicted kinase